MKNKELDINMLEELMELGLSLKEVKEIKNEVGKWDLIKH